MNGNERRKEEYKITPKQKKILISEVEELQQLDFSTLYNNQNMRQSNDNDDVVCEKDRNLRRRNEHKQNCLPFL